jgi:hypothetical protein
MPRQGGKAEESTSRTYVLKSLQLLQCTQTQAMQDAGDIIT